jgi:hypothetical protein
MLTFQNASSFINAQWETTAENVDELKGYISDIVREFYSSKDKANAVS